METMTHSATRKRNAFRRPQLWGQVVGYACFAMGGWVLWRNVELSIEGLMLKGWTSANSLPISYAIAALEAAVSIFLMSPENWEAIWEGLESIGDTKSSNSSLPGWVGLLMATLFLSFVVSLSIGAYAFDFFSTHTGLWGPERPIDSESALFTLAYNLGTELLSFFGYQALRMAKIGGQGQLEEALEVEPDLVYKQAMLVHRTAMAQELAKAQIEAERQQARNQNKSGKGNQ